MQIRFGVMELDPERFTLYAAGEPIPLRPKVFDLLIHLVRNRERVVSRAELVVCLWGNTIVGPGSLSGLVNELRSALGERGGVESSIRTVHARGYQFVAEVEGEAASSPAPRLEAAGSSRKQVGHSRIPHWLSERDRQRIAGLLCGELRLLARKGGVDGLDPSEIDEWVRSLLGGSATRSGGDQHEVESPQQVSGPARKPNRQMRLSRSRATRGAVEVDFTSRSGGSG